MNIFKSFRKCTEELNNGLEKGSKKIFKVVEKLTDIVKTISSTNDLLLKSVMDLVELRKSLRKKLLSIGINYIGDLIEKTDKQLKKAAKLTEEELDEIKKSLAEHKLELGMKIEKK